MMFHFWKTCSRYSVILLLGLPCVWFTAKILRDSSPYGLNPHWLDVCIRRARAGRSGSGSTGGTKGLFFATTLRGEYSMALYDFIVGSVGDARGYSGLPPYTDFSAAVVSALYRSRKKLTFAVSIGY